ncbi:fimbrial biogenesis chaperone [Deinococcus koreensis]|uniref:Pili assembly chaperone N-terminal domain-containing protein n=1 Tax=Deinococcus koreensis TaxID=2054903 RepID=A0A2K3UX16_9DEIO|nr:fimbria/pilus periplasmic chaperone [Deinococcus koreensis]PNY81077.1 hypothetical protein CVO96_06535 [Deinococcus koreensis]
MLHLRPPSLSWGLARRFLVAASALLAIVMTPVQAQNFGFTPTLLEIDASRNLVSETTLINGTTTPARFEVTGALWHIVNGQEVLDETRDLIVNPATFTVKPGGSQLIRVGVRKKPGGSELTYRLVVKQVPIEGVALPSVGAGSVGKGATTGMNIALTFSLPVYVTPPGAQPRLAVTATPAGKDISLVLQNSGARRTILRKVRFTRGTLTQGTAVLPLLSGSTITLNLPGLAEQPGPLTMRYEAEDGQIREQTVALP